MKPLPPPALFSRADIHFGIGALLAVSVVIAFVVCVHAF